MYVIAIHEITDPDAFWSKVNEAEVPAGTELPTVAPNAEGTRAVCVWKSDSVDTVKDLVDATTGDVSNNEFFAVNESNAQGLPG